MEDYEAVSVVDKKVRTFNRLIEQSSWSDALEEMVRMAEGLSLEERRSLFMRLAEIFRREFPKKGVDTELQRKQLARRFRGLIPSQEMTAGVGRRFLELSRTAGDHEDVVRIGLELVKAHPAQANHAYQAIGAALFNLKRADEAMSYLARVPPDMQSDSTKKLLERARASDVVRSARDGLIAAFALADSGRSEVACRDLNTLIRSIHVGREFDLSQSVSVIAGMEPETVDPIADGVMDELVPLFCGGFRWSGASAVYDYLADQPSMGMFWRRPRFMQDTSSSLESVLSAFDQKPEKLIGAVRGFFSEQIVGVSLGIQERSGLIKSLENSILWQIPPGTDLTSFDQHLAAFLRATLKAAREDASARKFPAETFAAMLRALSVLAIPSEKKFVLFDSVIRAAHASMLKYVPGARMVAVVRDPRDMYVTHVERGSWKKGVKRYIRELRELLEGFEKAVADEEISGSCREVRFEEFVRDKNSRLEVLRWLGLNPNENVNGPRFVPEHSETNIGVYRAFADQEAIRKLEAAFPHYCRGGTDNRDDIKVLTLSVMATRSKQMDRHGLAGKAGEPGWSRRREIVTNLLADGAFDFFGLQHCHASSSSRFDAVGFFRDSLAARGLTYGIVNYVAGEKPSEGDSTPLYYRCDRWQIDQNESGGVLFRTPVPPEGAVGGGGLYFVYGLFHELDLKGVPTGRSLYVYNMRLRNRHSDEVDVYRARCFAEVTEHMAKRSRKDVPVVALGDTNTKVLDSLADRLMRGFEIDLGNEKLQVSTPLIDTLLFVHPKLLGKVRTQHDFKRPGKLKGSDRNSRIFCSEALEPIEAEILTVNEAGMFPSYHYPVRATLKFRS